MEKLTQAMEGATKPTVDPLKGLDALEKAAQDWAQHCLKTHSGSLAKKGLYISTAIMAFTDHLKKNLPGA